MHTLATDDERRAALAAVAKKGVSERIRAAWTQASRRYPSWPDQTPAVGPHLLEGGRRGAAAALAAPPALREAPVRCFALLLARVRELQAAHGGACFGGGAATSSSGDGGGGKRPAPAEPWTPWPTAEEDWWAASAQAAVDWWQSSGAAPSARGDWSAPPAAPSAVPAAPAVAPSWPPDSGELPSTWPSALAPRPGVTDIREMGSAALAAVLPRGPSLEAAWDDS
ncbi:MAG: hypothetical protein GY772_17110 [bacterium]|nr:hypothetical protein [bacterium]